MSVKIFAIRHGATAWNEDKRLQGRQDIELSRNGRQALEGKRIPDPYMNWRWYSSPLLRARQTAEMLCIAPLTIAPELIEMDWGTWEGQRVTELRSALGTAMTEQEARGLDLEPPGGETPRQVRARVQSWLAQRSDQESIGMVCHKGVLRAMISSALNWNMLDSCPVKICWSHGLLFQWQNDTLELLDYNIPLSLGTAIEPL